MNILLSYPDHAFQRRVIGKLSSKCRVLPIGKSVCGREITALQFGGEKCCPLIAAGFHGMEYLTVLAALRFAGELAPGKSVCIVPCVNPDGTEIALHGTTEEERRRQANARGVDINHNFNADWENVKRRERAAGITCPGAARFGGNCPESEPETRALTRLCRERGFSRVLALHSQGREIYWDFGEHTPKECRALAEKMSEVSGYAVASPEPLATGGGFKDWFIQTFHRCGFTVEIGLGKNPLPLTDFEAEYPVVRRILNTFLTGVS